MTRWIGSVGLAALLALAVAARGEDAEHQHPEAPMEPVTLHILMPAEGGEQSVEALPGYSQEIHLPGNPTTGYCWELASLEPEGILKSAGDPTFTPVATDRVGAPGTFFFRFAIVAPGAAVLKLVYRRSWEKDVEPLYTATLHVTVH